MDPESPILDGKDSAEKPSIVEGQDSAAAAAKDLLKTPSAAGKNVVSLKVPITPALNREVEAASRIADASPDSPGLAGLKLERVREDSDDGCSTPKRGIFDSFDCESDEEDGDGCRTPRASVFDAFAPCKICPPTPGPVIPQRIRLF